MIKTLRDHSVPRTIDALRYGAALLALSVYCPSPTIRSQGNSLHVQTYTSSEPAGMSNAYLVAGVRDAILIDAVQMTSEATQLAAFIEQSGKRLSIIVITHAHPDHFLALDVLTRRFPEAKVVSVAPVVADIKRTGPGLVTMLSKRLGAEGPSRLIVPDVLPGDRFDLEGVTLEVKHFACGESPHSAGIYVPSSKTFFASDVVYSQTHLFLGNKDLDTWLTQLDRLEAWAKADVATIYPGHGPKGSVSLIAETRAYLKDFRVALSARDADEVVRRMMSKYSGYRMPRFLKQFSVPAFIPRRMKGPEQEED